MNEPVQRRFVHSRQRIPMPLLPFFAHLDDEKLPMTCFNHRSRPMVADVAKLTRIEFSRLSAEVDVLADVSLKPWVWCEVVVSSGCPDPFRETRTRVLAARGSPRR